MTIVPNHTIVPARDKVAAARFFADIFGLPFDATSGHFALVRANDNWTFLRGNISPHTSAVWPYDVGFLARAYFGVVLASRPI